MSAVGLQPEPEWVGKLLRFADLLLKWNRVYNLTGAQDRACIVSEHLLDSLAVARYLPESSGVDVGSGGGFPGIPLAIVAPQRGITLVDASQKKTAFLRQSAVELQLPNVNVVCERVESWRSPQQYAWVISRAFAELGEFVRAAGHLLARGGFFAAMKGVLRPEELAGLPEQYRVRHTIPLSVPGLNAKRHLVLVERV
jgi:16S rRNA (guanine527-N7)-methyltransferase